jgi:hypothetical protein
MKARLHFIVLQGDILACPQCGGADIHQTTVEMWNRADGAKIGFHVQSAQVCVHTDFDMQNNPSPKNDAVVITFVCLTCEREFGLGFMQHDGKTWIAWARVEPTERGH